MKPVLCLVLVLGLASPVHARPSPEQPAAPGIISHETEVTERQPQRLTPDFSQGPYAVYSRDSAPDAGHVAAQGANAPTLEIDVYDLSPSAHLLALPPSGASKNKQGVRTPAASSNPEYTGPSARKPRPLPPEWQGLIREASEIFGLDERLLAAVIRVESGFDAWAVSPAGAQGAMQIMPHTQVDLGLIDPFDPRANIYAGAEYLLRQIQRFGDMQLALAAYNAGPANVEKYGGIPPFAETQNYVKQVMHLWQAKY